MRVLILIFCTLFLTACEQTETEAQITPLGELSEKAKKDAANKPKVPLGDEVQAIRDYRAILQQTDSYGDNPNSFPITCAGVFEQGGAVKCQTFPNANLEIGDVKIKADKGGNVLIGFDRDAPTKETIIVHYAVQNSVTPHRAYEKTLNIAPREYAVSRIDGLPPSQVSTFSQAQLKHIRASSARKKTGFASREQTLWFKDGFTYPLKQFKKTSPFGSQRILNGEVKRPHYGVDIAAPVGTPIYAPADGVVSLADDDLYFEGAMVLLDHGQGLISMYLHMSAIDVKPGQQVKRGEQLGAVGSRGRSTGPHLCWRLKWRNRHLDPELLTKWPIQETHSHD